MFVVYAFTAFAFGDYFGIVGSFVEIVCAVVRGRGFIVFYREGY